MRITYSVLNPTSNITVLVETPVSRALRPIVASYLMKDVEGAEQLGFTGTDDDGTPFLEMAGGEFCGNATMSAAALLCFEQGCTDGQTVKLRVSGAAEQVAVKVGEVINGSAEGTVNMPKPDFIGKDEYIADDAVVILPTVRFPGMTHVIVEEGMSREKAEKYAPIWCADKGADALGIMLLDRENFILNPLVYVMGGDTLFWEGSCASGTAAVGAYLAYEKGSPVELTLKEPGGSLKIIVGENGELLLKGKVGFVERKTIDINI